MIVQAAASSIAMRAPPPSPRPPPSAPGRSSSTTSSRVRRPARPGPARPFPASAPTRPAPSAVATRRPGVRGGLPGPGPLAVGASRCIRWRCVAPAPLTEAETGPNVSKAFSRKPLALHPLAPRCACAPHRIGGVRRWSRVPRAGPASRRGPPPPPRGGVGALESAPRIPAEGESPAGIRLTGIRPG
jgi:hypothetical protein